MEIRDGEPLTASVLLCLTGLASSRSEALRLITSGGAYLNNRKLTPPDELVFQADLLEDRYVILRRGKKTVAAVDFSYCDDAEYHAEWSGTRHEWLSS